MFGLTAVDRVREAVEAAHGTQDTLNAFTFIDDEAALERAVEIDERINRGEYAGPLAGVPVGLKDLIDQKGKITTCGSAFYRNEASQDAPAVRALEEAGAVIIGRTGLHEWAFGFSSENPHWGVIRNPWDPETSPGGSSGGSAVAVAAGITPVSIGTDTGGSIRVPAALCGTFGLKTTYGRVPLDGVFPLVASIDTVGPLADSVENIDLAYRAMSGDSTPEPELGRARFGVPQPWHEKGPVEESVAEAFDDCLAELRALGHEVHSMHLPDVMPTSELWHAMAGEVTEIHREFRAAGMTYGDDVAVRLDAAAAVSLEQVAAARRWQQGLREVFAEAFQIVDFLITPTVGVQRKVIGVEMIGERHHRDVLSYYTALVNHSLHPAIAMPYSGPGAPPSSIQVIGRHGAEPALIGLARLLEGAGVVAFRSPSGPSPWDSGLGAIHFAQNKTAEGSDHVHGGATPPEN